MAHTTLVGSVDADDPIMTLEGWIIRKTDHLTLTCDTLGMDSY